MDEDERIDAEASGVADVARVAIEDDAAKKRKKKKRKSKQQAKLFHIETAFPWRVKNIDVRGRCAVATRSIKPGEIVVAESAVAFVARERFREALCHFCGSDLVPNAARQQCPSCRFTVFCEACIRSCSEVHKEHCGMYQAIEVIAREENCEADLLRLVFRLALEMSNKSSDTTVENGVLFPSFEEVRGLETHRDQAPSAWLNALKAGCKKLLAAASRNGVALSTSLEDLELLAAMVNTNAHGMGVQGLQNTDVALGIFPFVSKLNHSCRPNCCFASNGNVMYVRAIQDVSTGAELCVSYINLYEPRSLRRNQLAVTKHFECNCPRCSEPMISSIDRFLEGCLCNIKGCGGVLVRTSSLGTDGARSVSWKCDYCSRVLEPQETTDGTARKGREKQKPWELVAAAEKMLVEAVQVYSERRHEEARRLLEKYLSEFTGKLHQLHVLLFDALTPLMNCCRALGDADEGLRVCRLILQCMEKVLPGPSLELANFYFCLGEMYMERANAFHTSPVIAKRSSKLAQEAFERVKSIREVCLGIRSLPA